MCKLRMEIEDGECSSDPDDPTDYVAEAANNKIIKIATIKIDEDMKICYEGDFWDFLEMDEETKRDTWLGLENFANTKGERK